MSTQDRTEEPELQVMVWYNEKDWQTYLSLFDDAHLLPPDFHTWLELAEKKQREVEATGTAVVRVTIDTVLFPRWCEENGRKMDADSRTTFAIETVQRQQFLNNM